MDKFGPTHFGEMVWLLTVSTGPAISWTVLWLMLVFTAAAKKFCVMVP